MARNVSSGISRRIQALNQSTSREVSGYSAQSHPLTPETSPNSFIHQDHKDRKIPRRVMSNRRLSSKNSTPGGTPPLESAPVWNVQHDPATNSNSVSVSARIVRPQQEDADDDLQQSQLSFTPRDSPDFPQPINTSVAQSAASSPPLSPATTTSGEYRTLHSAASSRFNRRRKANTPPDDAASKTSRRSSSAVSFNDENAPPKEGSRTSRFFKRVSTLGGPKRKSVAPSVTSSTTSGTGAGGNRESVAEGVEKDTPPAVVVGDLNVQFPDSLLWKRRIVSIDDLGALQFSPIQGSAGASHVHPSTPSTPMVATFDGRTPGISARRFPLADFKAPHAPDLDRQELAHSVVLEFADGTTLQLACEDAMIQRQVLHLLRSYWRSWTSPV